MDTQQEINILKAQVAELTAIVNTLRNSSSIPFDIGSAFEDRLGTGFKLESLSGSTYGRSVNESGSATYSVAKLMDGTAPATFQGTRIYIPFYV